MLRTIWKDPERYRQVYFSRFGPEVYFPGDGAKRDPDGDFWLLGRIDGRDLSLEATGDRVRFRGPGFDVTLAPDDPLATLSGEAEGEIDLTHLRILMWVQAAVFDSAAVNHLNALSPREVTA